MKIKPKEALINLPIALLFDSSDEIVAFASAINTVLAGKQRLKYEELGELTNKFVGIFYLQRNDEFFELRQEFKIMIEQEEMDPLKPLNGREASCLSLLAQNPNIESNQIILNSLDGKALKIAKAIIAIYNDVGVDEYDFNILNTAKGLLDWAKGLECNCAEQYRNDNRHMPDCKSIK